VRLENNQAVSYEVFAEGWLQGGSAWGRPVDVLVMPDGALLVSDDQANVIYRINFKGVEESIHPQGNQATRWAKVSYPFDTHAESSEFTPPTPPGKGGYIARSGLMVKRTKKVKQDALLQNYPNPFNPETWIPYLLSKPAHVMIQIYSISGQLVRTLKIERRDAGAYVDRANAAYWDGRNNAGERMASGVYFYQMQADTFRATRKMELRQ